MTRPSRSERTAFVRILLLACLSLPPALAAGVAVRGSADDLRTADDPPATTTQRIALTPPGKVAQPFRQAEKPVQGSYRIRTEGGRTILTLSDDFRTSDTAPDLKIALGRSTAPLADSKPPAYPLRPGSYTVLQPLQASAGAQSYVIPASIDLKAYGSVLIWCEQFNATMAWAPLTI
jgi:hypothetical protein